MILSRHCKRSRGVVVNAVGFLNIDAAARKKGGGDMSIFYSNGGGIYGGAPFCKVVEVRFFSDKHCRVGEGSNEHVLECGHSRWEKQSYGYPKKMHCNECKYLAAAKGGKPTAQPTTAAACHE
jgi:hypothetical protein